MEITIVAAGQPMAARNVMASPSCRVWAPRAESVRTASATSSGVRRIEERRHLVELHRLAVGRELEAGR